MQIIISLDLFPFMSSAFHFISFLSLTWHISASLLAAKHCDSHADLFPFRIKNKKKKTRDERNSRPTTYNTSDNVDLCISVICINFMLVLCRWRLLLLLSSTLYSISWLCSYIFPFLLTHSFNVEPVGRHQGTESKMYVHEWEMYLPKS